MSYDNTNTGLLARNENPTSDKAPEFKGSVNVEGVEYWISAWVREGKDGGKLAGKKYFSMKLEPKEAKAPAKPARQSRPSRDDMDSDVPF